MDRKELEKLVIKIYGEQLGIRDFTYVIGNKDPLTANIVDDLGADDLDIVECIMALEEEFGHTITSDEEENIKTIKDAVDLIETKLSNKTAIMSWFKKSTAVQ